MDILLGVEMVQDNTYIYAQCQYERHPPVQNTHYLIKFFFSFWFLDGVGLNDSERQVLRYPGRQREQLNK